ncbi:MAG: hypothetical protein ACFWTN_11660 [Clostridium sp.]|jgi:hypothetical protein
MLAEYVLPVFLCTCFSFLLANNIDLCYINYKNFEKEGSVFKKDIFLFKREGIFFVNASQSEKPHEYWILTDCPAVYAAFLFWLYVNSWGHPKWKHRMERR